MASIPDRKLPTSLYAQIKDLLFEHIQSGELGGDADAIPILLGLGVDELSMASALILQAKAIIRTCDLSSARRLAKKALELDTASAVRSEVKKRNEQISHRAISSVPFGFLHCRGKVFLAKSQLPCPMAR